MLSTNKIQPDNSLAGVSSQHLIVSQDGDIFHAVGSGFFREEHIDPIFRIHEKVINLRDTSKDSYYFLLGLTETGKSYRRARKLYIDRIKKWYKDHPFKMGIFYGANRLLSAAAGSRR